MDRRIEALRRVLLDRGLGNPTYAVAAPLIFQGDVPDLLIEIRAAGISQAGDPCFPGGRIEPGETPMEAAAREMEEELGIPPASYLGQLPTVLTYLGSKSDVFVCAIAPEDAARIQPNRQEVAEVLRVPLSFFLERPEAESYTVEGHTVWGMTAGAIRNLCAAWRRAEKTGCNPKQM